MVSLCKILLIWGSYRTIYDICGQYIRLCMVQLVKHLGDLKAFPRDSRACPEKMLYLSQRLPTVIRFVRCTTGLEIFLRVFSNDLTPYCASGPSNKDICTILHRLLVSAVCSASSPPLKDPSQARLCYCFDLKFAIKLLVERDKT